MRQALDRFWAAWPIAASEVLDPSFYFQISINSGGRHKVTMLAIRVGVQDQSQSVFFAPDCSALQRTVKHMFVNAGPGAVCLSVS